MSVLFPKAANSVSKTYGWDVDLSCSQCKYVGQPRYEGWSPSLTTNTANATIYAKVACSKCGRRLTDEAGRKLVDLFTDVEISSENRKIISSFITRLILVPAGLAFILFFGMQMDWWTWGLGSIWILLASIVAIPLLLYHKNSRITVLLDSCECGKPNYVYMGSFDDTQCFRCFSCGRLMKLRE